MTTTNVCINPDKPFAFQNCIEEILALIKGHVPIIWVQTHEEARFIEDFMQSIAKPFKRQVWLWSAFQGLIKYETYLANPGQPATGEEADTNNPQKALRRLAQLQRPSDCKGICVILRDFHTVLGEPIPRQLRDTYEHFIASGKTLIVTSPILAHGPGGAKDGLPPTLEKQVAIVRYELPTQDQIIERLEAVIHHMSERRTTADTCQVRLDYSKEEIQSFARALQGLTMLEVDDATSTSLTHMKEINVNRLIASKKQILRKNEILEFIEQKVSMNEVGGLDHAKTYLGKYAKAYTDEAKTFGVEPLKGVLLTGIPGTGKSLLAKAIGNMWKLPLLRLDVGKVMTGLVGGSEGKMRDVICQAEAMSPCVLWIDEVEKSLSGTKSSNFSDGGTLARVFGTLLTAMQDGMEGVTLIATANDITMLPPEFIRRFNEVFFVDLPGPDERWEILIIHLKKRNRDIQMFESHKNELLNITDNYTGAEIEKAIKDAIAAAFYANHQNLTYEDLHAAIIDTKPIFKVMADKVAKLRDKARGQYRYASSWALEQSGQHQVKTSSGKKLDMNEALDDFNEFVNTPKEKHNKQKKQATDRFQKVINEE